MTLVERLRERADAYYGSQHEELRRVLDSAIARIEAAEGVIEHATASIHDYRDLVREQDKEGTDA